MSTLPSHGLANCYEILGISSEATLKDINSAYKKLALKHHPDKTGEDGKATEFQKIQEAVEILRDPIRRQNHDEELIRRGRFNMRMRDEQMMAFDVGYAGWRPHGMWRSGFDFRARYMYSYRNSVHMDPCSQDSQEELARCARERETDEWVRRSAEELAREAERERNMRAGVDGDENARRVGPYPFNKDDEYEEHEEEEKRGEEGDLLDANWMVADESGEFEVRDQDNDDAVNPDIDADSNSEADADPEGGIDPEASVKVEVEAEFDTGVETDIENVNETSANDGYDADAETSTETETYAEATADARVDAKGNTTPIASREELTQEYMTASQGTLSEPSSVFREESEQKKDLEARYSTDKARSSSSASVYFEFSDTDSPRQQLVDGEDSLIADDDAGYDASSSEKASTCSNSKESHIENKLRFRSHLDPFIPYFTAKLAHESGRYTKEDFHVELKGMVMETFCGWLETVRTTIPGARAREMAQDAQDCLHLGFWQKELGRENCEDCRLWRPLYMLVCPGCGIKKCVGCKFQGRDGRSV